MKNNEDLIDSKIEEIDNNIVNNIIQMLEKYDLKVLDKYKIEDKYYLILEFILIVYSEEENNIDLSFHISIKPDLSAIISLLLSNLGEIKIINVMESYIDKDGKILLGDEAEVEYSERLKNNIINGYLNEQFQLHYLKNNQIGEMC